MIYVFRDQASTSARLLAEAVDGIRLKRPENLVRRLRPTDKVIMWGAHVPHLTGLVLNNVPHQNKFEDARRLTEAGIRTVEVARQRPVTQPVPIDPLVAMWDDVTEMAEAFSQTQPSRDNILREGVAELRRSLGNLYTATFLPAPAAPPPQGEWLGRTFNHVGGDDLLNPPANPDFWAKKDTFTKEYRVHSFLGRSIRAGRKVPREGFVIEGTDPRLGEWLHPWIRSYAGGWMIDYSGEGVVKQRHRDVAHAAVSALGLQFGAVDLGERADGSVVVLEVNRAPGAEGGTVEAYGRGVRRWISGEWAEGGGREAQPAA